MHYGRLWYLQLINKLLCSALFLSSALAVFSPVSVSAHGTGYRQLSSDGAVCAEFYYSTGEPMSFAETLVFSPQDKEVEFQNGRTDTKGRFSFYPDCPGDWKIVVKDGMGHSVVTSFVVTEKKKALSSAALQSSKRMPLAQGIITGVGAILGLFGIVALVRNRAAAHKL